MVELAVGAVFAGFTIERSLGVGGMGTVYLAAHPRIPRKIALKVLHRSLTEDDYARTLFEREADHAARLDHPNIVSVLDRGRENGQLWIAMQYIAGTDAASAVEHEPIELTRAVHIIGEIAAALDYAHENGVLHRDVKPANILLEAGRSGRPGRVLLADFGIAKALTETHQLTKSGMLVASLQYAAPEQFEATPLDVRADVYSLGCTLFHLLTGRPPYPGSALPKLMHAHLHGAIPAPSHFGVGVPASFDEVIRRALAKDRADRYSSALELARAAAAAAAAAPSVTPPVTPPPPTRVAEVPRQETSPVTAPIHAPQVLQRPARKLWLGLAAIAVLAILATILTVVLLPHLRSDGSPGSPTTASAAGSTTMRGADGVDYPISGTIFDKYSAATPEQRTDLGPPMSGEKTNPDGKFQWFVGGVIIEQTGQEPHIVWGEIRNKWNELGGSQGVLGYPTSDEIDAGNAKVSTFERGTITFANGVAIVTMK